MSDSIGKLPRPMRVFAETLKLPDTLAGRMEFLHHLLQGIPIVDDQGNETGEYAPLIHRDTAARLIANIDAPPGEWSVHPWKRLPPRAGPQGE